MGSNIPKTLISGCVTLIILGVLQEKDMSATEIKLAISNRTDGNIEISQPSITLAIQKLHESGYVTSYLQDGGSRMRRMCRMCSITDNGLKALRHQRAIWETYSSSVNKLLDGPPDGADA